MIRNVVMVRLRPGVYEPGTEPGGELRDVLAAFRGLNCPGTVSYTLGTDLGLREGSWSFAIVADFVDAAAYRGYDADPDHNAARARLAPLAEEIARVQFELPG